MLTIWNTFCDGIRKKKGALEEHLEINRYAQEWQTPKGKNTLYDAIIEKCHLSPVVASKLRSILTFQIEESQINTATQPSVPFAKPTLPSESASTITHKTWLSASLEPIVNMTRLKI